MIYSWHAVIAYFMWSWVVRKAPVASLNRQVPCLLVASVALSSLATLAPISERNLGLRPHNNCWLRKVWKTETEPMVSTLIQRMVRACPILAGADG